MLIPFRMHGCISYFASRLPTQAEINDCRQIVFTSEQEWDPYSQTFVTLEKAYEKKERGPTEGEFFTRDGSDSRMNIGATSSHNRRSTVDAITLARRWGTSIETANHTLTSTTTRTVRFYPTEEFSWQFRTWQGQLRFPHLQTKWYLDTLVLSTVSKHGYQYGQLFCNDEDWATVVPICKKAEAGDALNRVVREYGIPEFGLHTDNAREESGDHTEWERVRKHFLIPRTLTEPYSPWMNRAEGEIG